MQMSTQTLVSTVTTRQYCASGRERDSGRLYESGFKKKNEKKRYLIDVQFSTDKKLATTQRKTARHCKTPLKSNIVNIGS